MLTVEEAIKRRRSIRKFKPDPIPEGAIDQLLEAARLAPSGSNRQPWRFLVVTDQDERKQLREVCLDQAFIEEAPVVFVCCADLTAYSQASRRARRQEFDASGVTETLSGRFADPAYRERMLLQPDMDRETVISKVSDGQRLHRHRAHGSDGDLSGPGDLLGRSIGRDGANQRVVPPS